MERKIKVLSDVARVVAELACTMRKDAIRKVTDRDLPLQDYLADSLDDSCPEDPLECLDYAWQVLDCLQKVEKHIEKGDLLYLSDEEREITDILVGEAPHDYAPEYVVLGRAVAAMVTKRLNECRHKTMTSKKAGELVADIVNDVKTMAEDHGIKLHYVAYAEPLAYINEWVLDRLYEDNSFEIKNQR